MSQHLRQKIRQFQQDRDTAALEGLRAQQSDLGHGHDPTLNLAWACALVYLGDVQAAVDLFQTIDADASYDIAAKSDHAFMEMSVGNYGRARALLTESAKDPNAGFEVFARLGALHLACSEYTESRKALERSLELSPNRAAVLSNLGGLEYRLGNYTAALEYYDRALKLESNLKPALAMRAEVLQRSDRIYELIEEAEGRLRQHPDDVDSHQHLASVQQQGGLIEQAKATLSAAIDKFPENDVVKRQLIGLLVGEQAWWQAGVLLKEWVDERTATDWTTLALNRMRIEVNFLDEAEASLEALSDTDLASEPNYLILRAKLLIARSRATDAVSMLQDAVEEFPGNMEAKNLLAHTLTTLGRLNEARQINEALSKNNPMALVRQVADNNDEAEPHQLEALEELFTNTSLTSDQKASIGFTLAPALDKHQKHTRAFEIIRQTNAYEADRIQYDWRRHRRFTERSIDVFNEQLIQSLSSLGSRSKRPIFVCGMPRSGTTLTEQILCTHPDVYGAGELPWVPRITTIMKKVMGGTAYPEAMAGIDEERLRSAAKYYLEKIAEQDNESPRVVDKLPHNFDNIGLIALMFPHVPIIHMDRDIRDVAISNFYQNFAAKRGTMGFAFDLEDIGHMLNDHGRIMQHWHEVFPGRIYELNYARLVSDPEPTIRELLEFCNLEWDERVMRFYETQRPVRTASIRQVRQGFYTSSTQKWRRYEAFLDPLEKVLAEGYRPLDEIEQQGPANALAGLTGLAGL